MTQREAVTKSAAPSGATTTDDPEADTIGARLRRRRLAKRLTLKEVAGEAGLSEGFLSQIERGVHSGSVATLQRIAAVLGLTVGDLFEESWSSTPAVHRFTESQGFAFGVDARKARLTPKSFQHLEVFLGTLQPGGSTGLEPYAHGDSEELMLVIDGEVEVTVGDAVHRMSALDSITYSSRLAHRVVAISDEPAHVLWAISPPSY
ncbi:XRE family transcriptional regulator [Nocardioides sp. NPDC004968]|uniref:XRE family transcriptional regulator n=1 Tax=Nocardioides sp. NPDC004968 TaxID=3155894 RepID=UPI0033AC195A